MTKAQPKPKKNEQEQILLDELEKYYGIKFEKQKKDNYIEELVQQHRQMVKDGVEDEIEAQRYEGKIAELRTLWREDMEDKQTPDQKKLVERFKDEELPLPTFPDDKSWHIVIGGKEDTGSMTVGEEGIVTRAKRLKNPDYLS